MLNITTKTFQELTTQELYDILQLRSKVFVVEQNCVYQDIDGKDQEALHVLGFIGKKLVAYTRIFKPGDYFEKASIGRVVVEAHERKFKHGYKIMQYSIQAIKEHYNEIDIKISAQCYLNKFYNNLGFKAIGEEYLEDGIPHITMVYKA
ncbi:GNAT family N-acetyltransferase [Meridianimaribacter flavus]|uniref:GNAT family N-acetyltransferase n=1 Tax=Gaetbulibacter sp. NE TaxID=2982307 RepID=UPI0021D0FFD7|nr:GNAT family N-acetyltransferase [Gaetbulibacter sp. NE]